MGEDPSCANTVEAHECITKLIEEFCETYTMYQTGCGDSSTLNLPFTGSRIYKIFQYFYNHKIKPMDALEGKSNELLLNIIYECNGIKPGLFIPELACECILREELNKFEEPCMQLLENVYKHLIDSVIGTMNTRIGSLSLLKQYIVDQMEKLLNKNFEE